MVRLRGALRRRIRPTFEEERQATAKRLRKLRKKRIEAEGRKRLSRLEEKELARIRTARAATKSGSSGLVRFGKRVLRDPKTKSFLKETEDFIFGKPKRRRRR